MPVLKVWGKGLPTQLLNWDIAEAIVNIPEMKLRRKKKEIIIIYPEFEAKSYETILVEIRILDLPERTKEVRKRLEEAIVLAIKRSCPDKKILPSISLV